MSVKAHQRIPPGESVGGDRPTYPVLPPGEPAAAPPPAPSGPGAVQASSQPFVSSSVTLEMTASTSGRPSVSIRDSQSFEMATVVADPLIGVVVAERYRILELLGRGGMGIVYRVEHVRIGKLLAMKLLTGELSRNAEVVRRFKHEALTASKLSSPNTVQVFDFGVSEGLTYLVMELVAGEDLGRILRAAGPMPATRLARVIIQVCSSLSEAHQKTIVHRDVKPENIMLLKGRDGTDIAKVLDFGLAKIREGSELNDVTSQGAIVGTPYFMSPEQVRGDPVDSRSDIYSLGAVMYRAVTGHYPFNGPTPMAVFTKHLTEMPISPELRVPELGISPTLNDMIMRALAKSPSDRYQRIEDLQADLVEEVRKLSSSSVETLLDSKALREMQKAPVPADVAGVDGVQLAPVEIATRDEVERYERKLRRKRWGLFAFVVVVPLGAAAWGAHHYLNRPTEFSGLESEPNDSAKTATVVPFGREVSAHIGRRIDGESGDRDFFAIEIPESAAGADGSAAVSFRVTSLPNFAMCTFLYAPGQSSAMAQYCVGRPARDLAIEALRLPPGRYLLAVAQDLDPYGSPEPLYVHENISDAYEVRIGAAKLTGGTETEPNDRVASANGIEPSNPLGATIGWVGDEDVYCSSTGQKGRARFLVEEPGRDRGTVLEATPFFASGPTPGVEGSPIRVHGRRAEGKPSEGDVQSPWQSEPVELDRGASCLKIRVVPDPWAAGASPGSPRGSLEPYRVTLELVP